jgi:hypothetical protein
MYNELAQKLKISKDEINKYQKNLVVLEQQKQMAASQTNQLAQTKNKLEALQKTWDNQKTQNIARLQRDIENQKEMKRVLAEYLQKK